MIEKANSISSEFKTFLALLVGVLAVFTLLTKYALPVRDGDLFFHLAYAKYFLSHKTIIADHTVFSWSPSSNDNIYCTWFADLLFYGIYKATGYVGLYVFRYICLSILVVGCFFYAKSLNLHRNPVIWFFCLISILLCYTAVFLKPEILTLAFLTLSCWIWWSIRVGRSVGGRLCYLLPVIMLFWVNSHGGFVFGAAFFAAITIGEIINILTRNIDSLPPDVRNHFFIAVIFSIIAIFINPYGYLYPLQVFHNLIPSAENYNYILKIAAYGSPFSDFPEFQRFHLYPNIAIGSLVLLYWNTRKRIEWSSLLANLLFAFLYTKFFRTTFYLAPVFLFSSIYQFSLLEPYSATRRITEGLKKLFPIGLTAFALFLAADSFQRALRDPEVHLWMGFGVSDFNPVKETEYIEEYFPDSKVGNTYNQGAYLIWKRWPENKVFFDARHFPYKSWSDDFFINFERGGNVEDFVSRYPTDIWLIDLRSNKTLQFFLDSPDWKMAFYGKNSMIFIRSEMILPDNAPYVADNITDLNNKLTTYNIFIVTCTLKEWSTADRLIAAIKANFDSNELTEWAIAYKEGMKNFFEKNYTEALLSLEKAQTRHFSPRLILSVCHQMIAAQAWKDRDYKKALQHVRAAWNLAPGNVYSAYNAGVIVWYMQKNHAEDIEADPDLVQDSWVSYLQFFLQRNKNNPELGTQLEIAKSLLNGNSFAVERLPLLTPFMLEDDIE